LTPVLVVGLLAVLGGSIGAGRFLTQDPTPTPLPTSPPTMPALAIIATDAPAPTPPPTSTPTPKPTATPEPTPTPDPRFTGRVVCLDVGHGGSDRGFTRKETENAPAMEEAHYNLIFARAVRARLETLGFTVIMTRDADEDVNATGEDVNGDGQTYANTLGEGIDAAERARDIDELQARINVCNDANAELLVSMHMNGFNEDLSVAGYETWYNSSRPFSDLNLLFAELAHDALGEEFAAAGYNARARGVIDDSEANVLFAGDAFDSFVITGPEQPGQVVPSAMPGAIVEVLFLSNDRDAAFIASPAGRDAVVTAYVNAIMRYFERTPRAD
jgi:N-acetylmuramoyl-L-alanine amidase